MDVALLVENYIELRKKLGSAVFDSRCLIFGAQTELLANNRPDILQFSSGFGIASTVLSTDVNLDSFITLFK